MQQVEAGKIDLDADINTYLDFKIPSRNGQSVTMRQIMKHLAGFEETAKDLITYTSVTPSLEGVLKAYVPPRMFDAGTTPAYSNYATALAGYVVERVSGQSFDDYIEQKIFAPLEMHTSSFRQPLPKNFVANMSLGYKTSDEPLKGYEIVSVAPAGSLASTGEDMGKFMIAHLQDGRYRDKQILKPETALMMHTAVTQSYPNLNGIALGFYEQNINGHRVIAHAGDTVGFHSDLLLFMDDNIGLYVSTNARGKDGLGQSLRQTLFEGFADRYLPAKETPESKVDPATAKAHAAMIAGAYIPTRRVDSTFVSLASLLSQFKITANPDGTIKAGLIAKPTNFIEVAPFFWKEVGGHERISAIVKDDQVVMVGFNSIGFAIGLVPPGFWRAASWQMPVLGGALTLLTLTVLLWPVATFVRWRYKQPFPLVGRRAKAYRLVRIGAVTVLVAIVSWGVLFSLVINTSGDYIEWLIHLAQAITFVGMVGGFSTAIFNLIVVSKEPTRWFHKLFAILLLAAFAALLWAAFFYHLIGVSANY